MTVQDIAERLYALPAGEFTRARDEAVRELRKAGQRDAAESVKALRRPTAAAAAVNRLVREHRGEVEQFLRAAAVLRDAQFSGKGDLAAATRQEHDELEGLIRIGGEDVRQTLLAAAVDDDAAHQLLEARLERELEPRGFGTLLAHARPPAPTPRAVTAAAAHQRRRRRSRSCPRRRGQTTAPFAPGSRMPRRRSPRPRPKNDTPACTGRGPRRNSSRHRRQSTRRSETSTDLTAAR